MKYFGFTVTLMELGYTKLHLKLGGLRSASKFGLLLMLHSIATALTLNLTVKDAQNISASDFMFVNLTGTLKQDGQIRKKLLVLYSVIALIYTSLYENYY